MKLGPNILRSNAGRLCAPVLLLTVATFATGAVAGTNDLSKRRVSPQLPPGGWARVSDTNAINTDEVGFARTADGVLHVLSVARFGTLDYGLKHTAISPSGKVGPSSVALKGFDGIGHADLVLRPDGGLQALFGATTGSTELDGIQSTIGTSRGLGWSAAARVSSGTNAGDVGAALGRDGSPLFAWVSGPHLYAHAGTSSADPDVEIGPSSRCCYYDPDIVVDQASAQAFAAFYSNVREAEGIFVRRVFPLGPANVAPGSVFKGDSLPPGARTPIVARKGGGVYLAYCSGYPRCTRVLLWRAGSGSPRALATGTDIEDVNIAAGPDGRLWVMWQDAEVGRVYATRTNKSASRFGAIVRVAPPAGAQPVWRLSGEGSLGPLDLFAHVSTSSSALATWHARVLPGLSLACRPGARVACTVRDAGDPVAGVKVTVAGRAAPTNVKGAAVVSVGNSLRGKSVVAIATKAGYTPASVRVKVA